MPARASSSRLPRGWCLVVAAALLAHLAIGVFRVPGVVFARRWQHIADYRARGAADYFLDTKDLHGAAVVEWIVANVPEDGAVLWRGDSKGPLECVPGLIAPRLLVREDGSPASERGYGGRLLATRVDADGQRRVVVVRGMPDDLRLEVR